MILNDINDTKNLAKTFSEKDLKGKVILLEGDLGAGKTAFTRFLLEFLEVKGNITSPTFVINKNYSTKFKGEHMCISHYDLYRIKGEEELYGLNILENLEQGNLVLIEWPEIAKNMLKIAKGYKICIKKVGDDLSGVPNAERREILVEEF